MKLLALFGVLCPALSEGARIHRGGDTPSYNYALSSGECIAEDRDDGRENYVYGIGDYDGWMGWLFNYNDFDLDGIALTEDTDSCRAVCDTSEICTGYSLLQGGQGFGCKLFYTKINGATESSYDNQCWTRSVDSTGDDAGAHGDPHVKNTRGQHFDIKQPGNHTLIVVPRGASMTQAQLHVEARVTPRGDVCDNGVLYITGLRLGGMWLRQLGGDVELYAATDKFNSPDVVGLRLGGSGNISLEEFVSRIPEGHLTIRRPHPDQPTKPRTHVNTLTLVFRVGPSVLKVGWSHEQLPGGAANWLWLSASRLHEGAGGLLGADDASEASRLPDECPRAAEASQGQAARSIMGSWASAAP